MHVSNFEKAALKLVGEDRLLELVTFLTHHHADGAVISGTGGFRKIRHARPNEGKSGGFRIIYFVSTDSIYPVLIYTKNSQGNLTKAQRNALQNVATGFKGE